MEVEVTGLAELCSVVFCSVGVAYFIHRNMRTKIKAIPI
jgi:hypothetical protein